MRVVSSLRGRQAFPELFGAALVAVFLIGLSVVAWTGYQSLNQSHRSQLQRGANEAARHLAAAIVNLEQPDPESVETLFERALGEPPAYAVRWVDPTGRIQAMWPPHRFAPGAAQPPPAVSKPLVEADGTPIGLLLLNQESPPENGALAGFWWNVSLASVVTLLALLTLYWQVRRSLRPLDAIRANLSAYGRGVERELSTMALSEAMGELGQAWNQLLQLAQEVRRESGLPADGSGDQDALVERVEARALRSTLDHLPVGVLRVGPDQRVTYANRAAAQYLECNCDQVEGANTSAIIDDSEICQALERRRPDAVGSTAIDRRLGEGDTLRTLRFYLLPSGERTGETLVTIQDISHLHEAEKARDNFLYHVTHELRTPLTNIGAYAETLARPDFDDEQTRQECYNVIISETRRLSRLVEDILSISQLEVGTAPIEMNPVDLQRLVRQTVQDNLGAAEDKSIELTLKLPPKLPMVRGDKQRLSVLLNNLIGNAVKYTPTSGSVLVEVIVGESSIEISVQDTGCGIPEQDQPHVFEKFYRASSEAVAEIPGTGLGLAISREVARLHGGDIRLQSQEGVGSTFVVELPHGEAEG